MRRCSLVAEGLEVGCAWCCNICGGMIRGGVGMYIIIYVWKRFEERIEMEQPPCRRDKSRCGVSLSGTASDRHPSSVISVPDSRFYNHLTYSRLLVYLLCTTCRTCLALAALNVPSG